jgi:hypothetical protein
MNENTDHVLFESWNGNDETPRKPFIGPSTAMKELVKNLAGIQ